MYRLLFETIAEGVMYHDAAGRVLSANHAARCMFGKSTKAVAGIGCLPDQDADSCAAGSCAVVEENPVVVTLQTGQVVRDLEMRVYNPHDPGPSLDQHYHTPAVS